MAGATLTDNLWANDILWQLSVFAYNISVMMRQKKDKFKRQEHRTFVDWFILVPARITRSGHQMEIKLYSLSRVSGNIIFTKPTGRSLTSSSKRHKKQRKEENMKINPRVYRRVTLY